MLETRKSAMKLTYVTTYNSSDPSAWSGSGLFILRSLQNAGIETVSIGSLKENFSILSKVKNKFYSKIQKRTFFIDRDPSVLKGYSAQIKSRLNLMDAEVIFSPGTIPISYLKTDKPLVFWTDATFAGMINFYPEFKNLCRESIRQGNRIEQLALSKCKLAIYASDWAASTAIKNYNVDPKKIKVVPFGANMDCRRGVNDIETALAKKNFDICKLLFVGVNWHRKGGDKAFEVAKLLNKLGIKTELHVVGCIPPFITPPFVKNHGFVSKHTVEGNSYLSKLFTESHFLILPSIAECFGVVFAEASSFGLPSLATKIGGITTAIRDDENGKTFNLESSAEEYCNYIIPLMSSFERYKNLSMTSFKEYSSRLNWHSAGLKVANLIQEFCF